MDSFSGDPFFLENVFLEHVRDELARHMRSPKNTLVLCVDKKSPMQAARAPTRSAVATANF